MPKFLVELATTVGLRTTYKTTLLEVGSDDMEVVANACDELAARDTSGRTEWRHVEPYDKDY